jgi:hypothetical protein
MYSFKKEGKKLIVIAGTQKQLFYNSLLGNFSGS